MRDVEAGCRGRRYRIVNRMLPGLGGAIRSARGVRGYYESTCNTSSSTDMKFIISRYQNQ